MKTRKKIECKKDRKEKERNKGKQKKYQNKTGTNFPKTKNLNEKKKIQTFKNDKSGKLQLSMFRK